MNEINLIQIFWLFLACLSAGSALCLLAVALGGYMVYRTKREDGRFFTKPVEHKEDEPMFYTDDENSSEMVQTEVPWNVQERSSKFVNQLFKKEQKVNNEKDA
jgi:hypothetical protein